MAPFKPKFIVFIFTLLWFNINVQGISNQKFQSTAYNSMALNDKEMSEIFRNNEKLLMQQLDSITRQVLPQMMEAQGQMPDVSAGCAGALIKMFNAALKLKAWPFQMLDAGTHIGTDSLQGKSPAAGSRDQCLDIKVPHKNGKLDFGGRFCNIRLHAKGILPTRNKTLVRFHTRLNIFKNFIAKTEFFQLMTTYTALLYDGKYVISVCVPSKCSLNDMDVLAEFFSNTMSTFQANVLSCEASSDPFSLTGVQIAIIVILSVFMLFNIIGTAYDLRYTNITDKAVSKPAVILLLSFSLRRNWRYLLSTKGPSDTTLSCFNGLRFCSMSWVILCHTFLTIPASFMRNPMGILENAKYLIMGATFNGFLGVDTFFFITSVLTTYLTIRALTAYGRFVFNPIVLIIKRVTKMFPMILLALAMSYFLQMFSYGPGGDLMYKGTINPSCNRNIWVILTFSQNYLQDDGLCSGHLWYIDADMHLFLGGLIYIALYIRNDRLAKAFGILFMAIGVTITATLVAVNNWPMVIFEYQPNTLLFSTFMTHTLFASHAHMAVYGLGLLVGTYLATRSGTLKMNKAIELLGWLVCAFCILFPIHCFYWVYRGHETTQIESVLYTSLFRLTWAVGLSWLTVMCALGKAKFLNRLLSWKGFLPLNRPTFMMYLVHFPIMWHYGYNHTTHVDTTNSSIIWYFMGYLLLNYAISSVMHMCIECPINCASQMITNMIVMAAKPKTKQTRQPQLPNVVSDANISKNSPS